jgi:protocatechuate 3,4-dioxygenase, alpha subunit
MTELGLTPSQTAGPYLRIGLLRELITTELVDPGDPRAIRIRGRLTDGAGDGVPDGMVEIWQPNAAGRYRHPADDREDVPLEDGFLGFGRSGTEDDGRFEFVTVKPGPVPWPEGGVQAPHIEVGIFARGLLKGAMTRIYFPDEPEANQADPVLSHLSPEQRETLVAVAEDGGLRFDIRLQGPAHTTFFTE